jgi:hypothetical protein
VILVVLFVTGRLEQLNMVNTLTWLEPTEGDSGGGFVATHPATGVHIEGVRRIAETAAGWTKVQLADRRMST